MELTTVQDKLPEGNCMNDVKDMIHWTDDEYGSRVLSMFSRILGYTLIATMTLTSSVQDLKTRDPRYDTRLQSLAGPISFRRLMIVTATGFIPLLMLTFDSTIIMWESSQWLGKKVVESTDKRNSRNAWIGQIPQIVKLLRKRSASGISTLSILLMLEASTATVAYAIQKGFPVSAWGENIVLMHENVIVVCLLLRYNERAKASMSFLFIYIMLVFVLLWPSVPGQLLWTLYLCSMPAIFASRVLQLVKNHQSKDPGQLSAMSSFLCIFQGFGRLTTSILTTCDDVMIYTFAAVSAINVLLFVQVVYYRYRLKKLK